MRGKGSTWNPDEAYVEWAHKSPKYIMKFCPPCGLSVQHGVYNSSWLINSLTQMDGNLSRGPFRAQKGSAELDPHIHCCLRVGFEDLAVFRGHVDMLMLDRSRVASGPLQVSLSQDWVQGDR